MNFKQALLGLSLSLGTLLYAQQEPLQPSPFPNTTTYNVLAITGSPQADKKNAFASLETKLSSLLFRHARTHEDDFIQYDVKEFSLPQDIPNGALSLENKIDVGITIDSLMTSFAIEHGALDKLIIAFHGKPGTLYLGSPEENEHATQGDSVQKNDFRLSSENILEYAKHNKYAPYLFKKDAEVLVLACSGALDGEKAPSVAQAFCEAYDVRTLGVKHVYLVAQGEGGLAWDEMKQEITLASPHTNEHPFMFADIYRDQLGQDVLLTENAVLYKRDNVYCGAKELAKEDKYLNSWSSLAKKLFEHPDSASQYGFTLFKKDVPVEWCMDIETFLPSKR